MEERKIKIAGTGKFLPERVVFSNELDRKMKKNRGWVEKKSGAKKRHFVEKEKLYEIGSYASMEALNNANTKKEEIDCIIFASASMEQLIPNTAVFIKNKMGLNDLKIPAIDINTSCLSFITALDLISYLIYVNKYKKVLIVSSEIASLGLNWKDPNTCTIFGDGAAAAIIQKSEKGESSRILASHMETYSSGLEYAQLKVGGARCYPTKTYNEEDCYFQMRGKAAFKLALKKMPNFIKSLLEKSKKTLDEIDLVIPHQASCLALKHLQKQLKLPNEKFMNIFEKYCNQISVSIPMALHEGILNKRIKRGDTIMLLGSSAGISLGGIILEY